MESALELLIGFAVGLCMGALIVLPRREVWKAGYSVGFMEAKKLFKGEHHVE